LSLDVALKWEKIPRFLWATSLKNLQPYYVHTANHIIVTLPHFWNLSLDVAEMGKKRFLGYLTLAAFGDFCPKSIQDKSQLKATKTTKSQKLKAPSRQLLKLT